MNAKKLLKRNLAAVVCAGMLFNPAITAFAAETEDTSAEKNPTMILNIKDNEVDKEFTGLQFNLFAGVYDKEKKKNMNINCGHYDTEDKSSICVEIPKDIFNKFTDEKRYEISFYIEPYVLLRDFMQRKYIHSAHIIAECICQGKREKFSFPAVFCDNIPVRKSKQILKCVDLVTELIIFRGKYKPCVPPVRKVQKSRGIRISVFQLFEASGAE